MRHDEGRAHPRGAGGYYKQRIKYDTKETTTTTQINIQQNNKKAEKRHILRLINTFFFKGLRESR